MRESNESSVNILKSVSFLFFDL